MSEISIQLNETEVALVKAVHDFTLELTIDDGESEEGSLIYNFYADTFSLCVDFSVKWNCPGPPYVFGCCLTLKMTETLTKHILRVSMLGSDVVQVFNTSTYLSEKITPEMIAQLRKFPEGRSRSTLE